tara:strand:- start:4 stop:186 length:183 start_codon:yes stop_codon:yes gene_type:complete
MPDLNQLVQERATLTKTYNDTLEKWQKDADTELAPLQQKRVENQRQIDALINTNAGVTDA